MRMNQLELLGCFEIFHDKFHDARGDFVKTFHADIFNAHNLMTDWREEYYSISKKSVIRGMHFQMPPSDHAKLVHCISGEAIDVIVDLRKGSPSFGKYITLRLGGDRNNSVYIPTGFAHGFVSCTDECVMHYKVTSVYSAEHDRGILWSSLGYDWPVDSPIVSVRDMQHPPLSEFDSPFIFDREA